MVKNIVPDQKEKQTRINAAKALKLKNKANIANKLKDIPKCQHREWEGFPEKTLA
jgi:hypothetical protein